MNTGITVRERRHLQPLQQILDVADARQQDRDDHHRPRVRRQIAGEFQALETLRQNEQRDQTLNQGDRHFAGGYRQQRDQAGPEPPARHLRLPIRVSGPESDQESGDEADRSKVKGGRRTKHQALQALRRARPVPDVGFEIAAPPADQVVADVRRSIAHRARFGDLTGAFERSQRDADLGLAGRRRQFLDRLPLAVPAQEVHGAVHAGGIASQHLLDEADGLEVVAPVQGRAQPQAREDVGDRHLGRGLTLMFAPDRVLRRQAQCTQVSFDRRHAGAAGAGRIRAARWSRRTT